MEVNDLLRAIRQGAQSLGTVPEDSVAGFAGPIGTELSPEGRGTQVGGAPGGSADPLGGILDAILGGGAGSQQPVPGRGMPSSGGGPLGGILDAILGGAGSQPLPGRESGPSPSSGPLGGILDAVLGGGGVNPANNSMLAPIAGFLSEKFGVPPKLAMVIVSFAVTKLLAAQVNGGADGRFQVNQLMDQLNSTQGVTSEFAADSGMAEELAAGTGIDSGEAAQMLQAVYNQLGTNAGATLGMTSGSGTGESVAGTARSGMGEKRATRRGSGRRRKGGPQGRQG